MVQHFLASPEEHEGGHGGDAVGRRGLHAHVHVHLQVQEVQGCNCAGGADLAPHHEVQSLRDEAHAKGV